MGSSTPEAGRAVGDPLAAEARRRVRARFHRHPDAPSMWAYVCTMARAAAEASANDDAGTMGGPLALPHID